MVFAGELFEQFVHPHDAGHRVKGATNRGQSLVRILDAAQQPVGAQHEALNVVGVLVVDGDARKGAPLHLVGEALEGHVRRQAIHHRARRHDVGNRDGAQIEDVVQNAAFADVEIAGHFSEFGHGQQLLPVLRHSMGLAEADQAGDLLTGPYNGGEGGLEPGQEVGGGLGEKARVARAQGLGNDFGEHEYCQSQHTREDTAGRTAELLGILGARAGRSHGVSDGIERENGRERLVDVALECLHPIGPRLAPRFGCLNGRRGDGQQGRLQQ